MHLIFGEFLESAATVELDDQTCASTLKLITAMSESYADTNKPAALKITRGYFGELHAGKARGTERKRSEVRPA